MKATIACAQCGIMIPCPDNSFECDYLCDKCEAGPPGEISGGGLPVKKRIAYISDVHINHYHTPFDVCEQICKSVEYFDDVDWLMIAGDLADIKEASEYLAYIAGGLPHVQIFFVPGNHELYGSHIQDIHAFKHKNTPRNLHIMNRDFYYDQKDDILVVGAVGWIDGSWHDIYSTRNKFYKEKYNDFRCIKGYQKLAKEYGRADYRALQKLLKNPAKKKIVMTHFLPTPELIELKYMGNAVNHCYANNWDHLSVENDVDVWIFGHSHHKSRVTLGKTKYLTNAIGYPSDPGCDVKVHIIEI